MKVISTRTHGMLDYTMGIILIISPWLFNFARGGAEMWIPIIIGAGVILYSVFTDYEMGGVRVISMPTHLWLDGLGGLFLAASPWLFGFADFVYLPHLIFGLAEIGVALMTNPVPRVSPMDSTTI
ncbi:MAG: SPW repeat protein [Balneolaceae bacterium]